MSILTNAQVATLQRVLSTTNHVLPRIEMLEALGQISPELRSRVGELRTQREYLKSLSDAALEINRQIAGAQVGGFAPASPPPSGGFVPVDAVGGLPPAPRPTAPVNPASLNRRVDIGARVPPDVRSDLESRGRTIQYDNGKNVYWYLGDEIDYQRWMHAGFPLYT